MNERSRTGRLILPAHRRELASTGRCLLHSPTTHWNEESVVGRRIIFDKYAGKRTLLGDTEFWIIPELACMAVFQEDEEHGNS